MQISIFWQTTSCEHIGSVAVAEKRANSFDSLSITFIRELQSYKRFEYQINFIIFVSINITTALHTVENIRSRVRLFVLGTQLFNFQEKQ